MCTREGLLTLGPWFIWHSSRKLSGLPWIAFRHRHRAQDGASDAPEVCQKVMFLTTKGKLDAETICPSYTSYLEKKLNRGKLLLSRPVTKKPTGLTMTRTCSSGYNGWFVDRYQRASPHGNQRLWSNTRGEIRQIQQKGLVSMGRTRHIHGSKIEGSD